jgi:hypothetical protein
MVTAHTFAWVGFLLFGVICFVLGFRAGWGACCKVVNPEENAQ